MLHVNNLARRIARHRPLIDGAFRRVLDSGWFVLGLEVTGFEAQFASYIGCRHAISVANGTDALRIALLAAGIGPGDGVATAANAGMYATTAILGAGADPIFMDVDAQTHCVVMAHVERAVTSGAKAVIATHLYGHGIREIADIAAYCRGRGVLLIEDCAQAHGAMIGGRHAGSFGNAACFSFYPTKNLGGTGDGGAIVSDDEGFSARARRLRQYGWSSKYTVDLPHGGNSRLDELQAAVLSELLAHLDADNARRRTIAGRYSAAIKAKVSVPPTPDIADVAHLYVLRVPAGRENLRRHLEKNGVGSDIHYPVPDHRQPVFGNRFADICLPVTEQLAGEVLTLPCFPEITDEEVGRVINAVNGWAP